MFPYRSVVVNSTTVFILRDLPVIALAVRAPPVVWRAETGFQHHPDSSAADVARYEQETLGNSLELPPGFLLDLETYPACALLWVTFTYADALRYGDAEDVQELRLDISAYVIATDNE
jgi:hypothetical protein